MENDFSLDRLNAIEGLADALRRETEYERWFCEKVRESRLAAERGEFTEHGEVRRVLSERYRS